MVSDWVITCSGVHSVKIGSAKYVTDWITEKLALASRQGQEIFLFPAAYRLRSGGSPEKVQIELFQKV